MKITFTDPQIQSLVVKYGPHTIKANDNHYRELLSSIVSQQLSVKVADTIWKRVLALFGNETPTPKEILCCDSENLRACGISYAKIKYMKDLAGHIDSGKLNIYDLAKQDNQTIIDELTKIKGIGTWTAQMYLIFCLGRPDVMPVGDLGIRTAIRNLYNFTELPTADEITKLATVKGWSPNESIVSWYLWKSLDNKV